MMHAVQMTFNQSGMRMAMYCMHLFGGGLRNPKKHRLTSPQPLTNNYQRNLMRLTGVPTMNIIWVTKHSSFVPMRRRLGP
jgi:hypothetical protein